jgi:hypothetical protein
VRTILGMVEDGVRGLERQFRHSNGNSATRAEQTS